MRVGLLVGVTTAEMFQEAIDHVKSFGFDFGQLCIWNAELFTDENAELLKELMEKNDFRFNQLWCGWHEPVIWSAPKCYTTQGLVPDEYRETRLENLRQGALFAYKAGIDTIITHCGYIQEDPTDPTFIAVADGLRKLCEELASRGQRFAFETGQEMPVTLKYMINAIGLDNVGINLDPANLTSGARGNPYDAVDLLHTRIFGVHAKDASKPTLDKLGRQEPIGAGDVDFRRLIKQLHDYGYEGDLIIEHEIGRRAAVRDDDIRFSKVYLENIIENVYTK